MPRGHARRGGAWESMTACGVCDSIAKPVNHTMLNQRLLISWAGLLLLTPPLRLYGQTPPPTTVGEEEIGTLVQDLGEASYEARTKATLRLIAIGSKARPILEKAATGNDVEQSLRAKRILQILDSLYFLDAEVHLAFSQSSVRWDEPVSLTLTFTNKSDLPSQVPFELDANKRKSLRGDALQVADMLDVAEWLHLFSPSGAAISLRVDDISKDAEIVQVVEERINGGPLSKLDPAARVSVGIKDFNRGWARFPLLDAGDYTAFLEYVPAWNDESLAKARVGVVRSNTATITVTQAAPAAVSRTGVEAEVTIEPAGQELIARLINHSDLPAVVNTNFGSGTPMAHAFWALDEGERRIEAPVAPDATWRDFTGDKLVELKAGESLILARTSRDALVKEATRAGLDVDKTAAIFTYSNFCDSTWQAAQGKGLGGDQAPEALRRPLPRRMLTTRQSSAAVPLDRSP
jgi:hypothetical protein